MASEVLRKSRHSHNRRPWQTLQRLMSRLQCDRKHVLSAGDCRNMDWHLQRQRFQIKHIACRIWLYQLQIIVQLMWWCMIFEESVEFILRPHQICIRLWASLTVCGRSCDRISPIIDFVPNSLKIEGVPDVEYLVPDPESLWIVSGTVAIGYVIPLPKNRTITHFRGFTLFCFIKYNMST